MFLFYFCHAHRLPPQHFDGFEPQPKKVQICLPCLAQRCLLHFSEEFQRTQSFLPQQQEEVVCNCKRERSVKWKGYMALTCLKFDLQQGICINLQQKMYLSLSRVSILAFFRKRYSMIATWLKADATSNGVWWWLFVQFICALF